MFDQDYHEQDEQQKLDKAQGGQDESFEEDSDYFSFDRVRDRALRSEYGDDLSRDDTMDDTGNYKFNTGDELNLQEIFTKREKIYTYHYLRGVIHGMEPNEVFPNLEDLEEAKLMGNIRRRIGAGGVFLGIDFVKDGTTTNLRIINRKRDPTTKRLTGGFEFNDAEKSGAARKIFKDRLEKAREKYRKRSRGVIEEEVRSVLSMDSDASEWSTATEGSRGSEGTRRNPDQDDDDDNQSQGTVINNEDQGAFGDVVRYNRDRDEVSIEQQQENRGFAEVIEEEVEQTKFEVIEEVENDMQGNRDNILARFAKLVRDIIIEPYGETDYLKHVEEVMKPISEMQFYQNPEFFYEY